MAVNVQPWRVVAFTFGACLVGIEIKGAVEYLLRQEGGQFSYIVAGGAVVTAVAPFIPWLAERSWHAGNRFIPILLMLAMLPALSLIVTAAIERTGGARDAAGQAREAVLVRMALAKKAETEAAAQLATDEAAAADECKTGRGPRCTGLEDRAAASRARLSEARDAIAAIGPAPIDSQARRIAAILPLTEQQVELYQPIILPVTVSLLGILFLSAAFAPGRRKGIDVTPEPKPRPSPTAKAASTVSAHRPIPVPAALPRPAPSSVVELAPRKPHGAKAKKPEGRVGSFLRESLLVAVGDKVGWPKLYAAYRDWCQRLGFTPVTAGRFGEVLVEICDKAGIVIEDDGQLVYCVDRKLAG
jgi:hypothetical protein